MSEAVSSFFVNVDVTNPGQFFACCGLLEMAHRLWPGAEGWFENGRFRINSPCGSISEMIDGLGETDLVSDDSEADEKTCPLRLLEPINVRLDWWLDENGERFKTWAGQQSVLRIARGMKQAIAQATNLAEILEFSCVVKDTDGKKDVEPFFFDARRFAHALDTGFSLDVQDAQTVANPAVEILTLIGLQRFRPAPMENNKWAFEYSSWSLPLAAPVAAAVVCGAVSADFRYRFSLLFRDDQKRYKAFDFAKSVGGNNEQ